MSNLSDELISNTSYTAKDFNSIYPELLDLVSKITNKWDPSQSNESDPGVVLLKLVAIMADKNNYNIDKNVLECFPLSVTQEKNARNLYDSLGYNMHWYKSAVTGNDNLVGFSCSNRNLLGDNNEYTIPAFTPLTDSTNEIIYTTLQKVTLNDTNNIIYTPCIQGTYKDYSINGERKITVNSLDSERKLYFTDSYIAENGIFIIENAVDVEDIDFYQTLWKRVDNLTSYPSGNLVYQFGITENNVCYIQFPEDIAKLINNGMYIRYIISDGENGNIKANTLTNFAIDLADETSSTSSVNDYINIIQRSAIVNGENPETLEDAYTNYKKTIGTFNTLVTRRDYENFINRLGEIANCVVSDRTNDINYTDYIQEWEPEYNKKTLVVKTDENNKPLMDAFKVFLYLNKNVDNINSISTYTTTFTPDNDAATLLSIEGQMDEIKAVQHDVTVPGIASLVFNYNNFYDINGLLYLKYKVTNIEKIDIENNVKLALIKKFNAKKVAYGKELDYQEIVDTIIDADDRISNVLLSGLDYKTSQRNFANQVTPLKSEESDYQELNKLVARMILAGNVQLYKFDDEFQFEFGQENSNTFKDRTIKAISTHADINLTTSDYSVKENEVIQIVTDNFITTEEYGAYCEIQVLGGDDWSNEPTNQPFEIPGNLRITYYDENNVQQTRILPKDTIIETNHKFSNNTTQYILSSSEYIRVKNKNEYNLTSGTQYLGIFNNPNKIILAKNEFIILQENEYFIYPNSTKTDLIILGMGTKLTNENDETIELRNSTENVFDINKNNIDKLKWNTLQYGLKTIETTIISLGQNVSVKIQEIGVNQEDPQDPQNSLTLELDNDYKELDNNLEIVYKNVNETNENSIRNVTGVQEYIICSRLNINSIKTNPQKLDKNQWMKLDFTNGSNEIIGDNPEELDEYIPEYIQFNTNVVLVGGNNINMGSLKTDINGEISVEYLLKGYSYVLNSDYTLKRDGSSLNLPKLIESAIIKFKDNPTLSTDIEIRGIKFELNNNKIYNNITINSSTSEITYESEEAGVPTVTAYANNNWTLEPDCQKIKIKEVENDIEDLKNLWTDDLIDSIEYSLPFNFQDNEKYLVPIKVILNNGEDIEIDGEVYYNPYGLDYETGVIEYEDNATKIKSNGSYILNPSTQDLKITIKSVDDRVSIGEISKISSQIYNSDEINYKDLNQDYRIQDEIDGVLAQMKGIDEKNKFNWTYQVDANEKVLKPTSPASFWNSNHIGNEYTLPIINFENINITVSPSYLQQ